MKKAMLVIDIPENCCYGPLKPFPNKDEIAYLIKQILIDAHIDNLDKYDNCYEDYFLGEYLMHNAHYRTLCDILNIEEEGND